MRALVARATSALPVRTQKRSRCCFAALLCLVIGFAWSAADPAADPAYQSAIAQARRGEFDAALNALAQLIQRYPTERLYLYDYVSVLERASRHEEALDLLDQVERGSAPAYVLESLGAAATALHRFDLAEGLYGDVLTRYAGRAESREGLAAARVERIAVEGAVPAKTNASPSLSSADRLRLMQSEARQLEAKGLFYPALSRNQDILQLAPDNLPAQAAVTRIAARLGAGHQATRLLSKYPEAADAQARDTLARNRVAVDARWAERLRALPGRYREGTTQLDAAIAQSDALVEMFLRKNEPMTEAQLRWLQDRIVLLGTRRRARDAVRLYERFVSRNLPVPDYALRAVADSMLQLRQPVRAKALYERALKVDPEDADARVGLYFSLLEAEAHEQAYAWVDEWARAAADAQARRPNAATKAQHWSARVLQARAREYAGELALAQGRLEALQGEAPANAAVRAGRASVYRARGWPRKAWETWQLQLLQDPDDVDAYAESVYPLLDSYRFEHAQRQLSEAQQRQPDTNAVGRASRAWQLHERPELFVAANLGRSNDANLPSGTRDDTVDAYLYSAPLGQRYRAYVHGHYAQADLAGGYAHYNRAGVGLEYRGPDLRLTGEAHAGVNDDGGLGLLLGARWWISDIWSVLAEADTKTLDLPLQARQADIDAKRAHLEVEARIHDTRSFVVALTGLDFSDDNRRRAAQFVWREGLLVRPRYALFGRVDFYASRNSRENAPYFNPSRDWSAGLSLTGAWRIYRFYERELVQELTLSAGNYWQKGFGSGATWGIEYAHRWQLNDAFYLRYGLGRTLHPYDGQQSGRNYLTLDLDWRF